MNFGLWAMVYGLRAKGYGLLNMVGPCPITCGLWSMAYGIWLVARGLLPVACYPWLTDYMVGGLWRITYSRWPVAISHRPQAISYRP